MDLSPDNLKTPISLAAPRRESGAPEPADIPQISPFVLQNFHRYIRFYLRRSFHAVRLSRAGQPPHLPDMPLVIFLNHPSWWDPLVCLFLTNALFPDRRHYGPLDAEALARYRIFARMGFFGVTPGSRSGALTFLRVSQAILHQPQSALWITPEGAFTDPRQRPTRLQSGISHLAVRLDRAVFVPLALEYPFWQERFPEVLVRFGEGIPVEPGLSVEDYTERFSARLEATQDALAQDACQQDRERFEVLLSGNAGIGGIYDVWRSLRARWRGETFRRSHGADES
jgi:1-acyl-sn-glycerol-3-phosphate acyltransferase